MRGTISFRGASAFLVLWLLAATHTHCIAGEPATGEPRPLAESLGRTGPAVSLYDEGSASLVLVVPGSRTYRSPLVHASDAPTPWEVWRVPVDEHGPGLGRAIFIGGLPTFYNTPIPPQVAVRGGAVYCAWAVQNEVGLSISFAALLLSPVETPSLLSREGTFTMLKEKKTFHYVRLPEKMSLKSASGQELGTYPIPISLYFDGEGKLCLIFRGSRGRLFIAASPDRGATWSPARLLSEAEAKAVSVPRASPLPAPPVVPVPPPPAPRWPLALGAGIAAGLGGLAVGFLLAALCFRKRRAA